MTPEQQRIKIAEAQGIFVCDGCNHVIDPDCCHCGSPMAGHGYHDGHAGIPAGCTCGYVRADDMRAPEPEVPNYLEDLNAMHKVEEWLLSVRSTLRPGTNLWVEYRVLLQELGGYDIHATAAQRAEAFLRALGLWTG